MCTLIRHTICENSVEILREPSKMCTLIRHTTCENLVEIQEFRQEYTQQCMYENTTKTLKSKPNGFLNKHIPNK